MKGILIDSQELAIKLAHAVESRRADVRYAKSDGSEGIHETRAEMLVVHETVRIESRVDATTETPTYALMLMGDAPERLTAFRDESAAKSAKGRASSFEKAALALSAVVELPKEWMEPPPEDVKPEDVKPGDTKPGDTKPGDVKPDVPKGKI